MFKGTVPAIAAKEYTMCYCDDQAAGGGNVSSSSSKYTVTQDYVCDLDPNADGQYGCFEGGRGVCIFRKPVLGCIEAEVATKYEL